MAGVKGMKQRRQLDPQYAERLRERIIAGGIANALIQHAMGKRKMSNTEVQAALGLVRKVIPDLSATELTVNSATYADELQRIAGILRERASAESVAETPIVTH